ncbi:MAG: protein-disulfide reductase DsbD domain-containing protein, partial [Phycisphaerae bacterium]
THTLDAMARGGIHDHVGGGFHRYATDAVWLVPHFEKMLYDNAQLARAYVDACAATGNEHYGRVARDTYEWVLREMADEAGGFHSALDADSEGEEGRFYLWSRKEIMEALGRQDGEMFCRVYNVSEVGNFADPVTGERPGTNILHLTGSTVPAELRGRLSAARRKLLARRVRRVWPHRDDKVLVSWNALMIGSLAHGGRVLNEPRYTAAAEKAAEFILTRMRKDGRLLRTYRAGQAKLNAYLDDYAFLADALLELHVATGRKRWLDEARSLAETMLKHHGDPAGGGFFFTSGDHEDLLARTKEPADSALPSGNAVAAGVLVRLARLTGEGKYLDAARDTLEAFEGFMQRMPTATAGLLLATAGYLDAAAPPSPQAAHRPDAVAEKKPVRVELFASHLTARPGGTIDLAVRIAIDEGWHINSHRPLQKDLVATAVGLAKGWPGTLVETSFPHGRKVHFAFSPEALSVYEGTVWILTTARLDGNVKPGPLKLDLIVTAQACNDSACLSPETHVLAVPLEIDPDARPGEVRHPSIFVKTRP